jgi:tetratricopeptide (TPR) repeat protein
MVWFTFKTVQRSIVWKDNYTLFTTDAATYPQSVRLNNGAAEEMLKSANLTDDEVKKDEIYTKTEAYCNKIMEIKPVATAYLTLGNIRMNQKKYQEAIDYYDQVNDLQNIVDVNKALAYRELGRIAGEKEQNLVKSQELLSKSLKLNDKDAETWFLLGVSHGVAGNHQQAAEFFEKAYTINPTPDYAKNAIMAYKNLGNETKVAYFQSLLNGK